MANITIDSDNYTSVTRADKSEVILITRDKLELIIKKYGDYQNHSKDWIAPAGILATCIASVVSSGFTDFLFPAATWQAIFVITGVLSFIWLLYTLKFFWGNNKIKGIENIMQQINEASQKQNS